jgi:hypothetical protein
MKNRLFVAAMAAISILGTGIAAQDAGEEPTVEKLLQQLLAARGGAERWGEIKSLRIEGTWTAFSEDMPMTILRMRPNLYRFEHTVLGAPSILAFDGSKAWMQGAIYGAPDGQWIEDSWKRNVIEEAPFVCKLLDHAASGAGVELVGRQKVEGKDAYVLEVTLDDAPRETWYLDADTFLETKRVSMTFDLFSGPGIELEMETFYTDFRDVDGVKIPHREEQHFGTRYRVFEAASIEVNPEVNPDLFEVPDQKEKQENEVGGEKS